MVELLNRFSRFDGLKEGVVVKFKGMVQDSMDRVLKHKAFGEYDLKFRRGLEGIPMSYKAEFSDDYYSVDRYILVSVPGENAFDALPEAEIASYFEASRIDSSDDKRDREECMDIDTTANAEVKKTRFDCTSEIATGARGEEPPAMIPLEETGNVESPRTSDASASQHPIPSSMAPPIIGETNQTQRISCLASICDDIESGDLKLHEIVEVEGIIFRAFKDHEDSTLPPVDFTMEVMSVRKLNQREPPFLETKQSLSMEEISQARCALKSVLHNITNDSTLAEYLLLHLVSRRIPGNDQLPTMGSWVLNVSDTISAASNWPDLLSKFVKLINTAPTVHIPTSNEILLNERFYPHRTADQEYTAPGILQLTNNTTAIIDERNLGEGNVNALNVLTISKAVRDQVLLGIFGSGDFIEFPLDIKFLIISSTKSLFTEPAPGSGVVGHVPVVHLHAATNDNNKVITDNSITLSDCDRSLIQRYIEHAQEILINTATISEETVTEFQNKWVNSRKIDSSIPTDDIHVWATLLKVMSASHGREMANLEHLNCLVDLEEERRSRISKQSSRTYI